MQIQTAGYSLLTPTVSIFNAAHQLVGTASSTSPLDGNVQVTISGALPLATYYLEVSHATSAFAVGGYHADVSYQGPFLSLGGLLSTVTYVVDHGLNNTIKTATVLVPVLGAQTDQRFDYLYRANISDSKDTDFYQVQAPNTQTAGQGWTMHALVWAADSNMLHPQIHAFDAAGNPLAIQVLDNGNGEYTIQGSGYVPGAVYYLEVLAWTPTGANNVGNYVLGVKFDLSTPVAYALQDAETLTANAPSSTGILTMNQNQLYQFSLAADTFDSSEDASVTMTVYDSLGNLVTSLTAVAGRAPVTRLVYLTTGDYTISYTSQSLSGNPMPNVDFWFLGSDFTEPSGPYYVTPGGTSSGSTGSGTPPPGTGSGSTGTYTSSSTSSGASQPYYY